MVVGEPVKQSSRVTVGVQGSVSQWLWMGTEQAPLPP